MTRGSGAQVAFTPNLTLDGWLAPGAPGAAELMPIAEAAGDGSILALWRSGDSTLVVLLGGDGAMGIVAESIQEFLELLAIGYDELPDMTLGCSPEDPLEVGEFRDWLIETFGIDVPEVWPEITEGQFNDWMAIQLA